MKSRFLEELKRAEIKQGSRDYEQYERGKKLLMMSPDLKPSEFMDMVDVLTSYIWTVEVEV